MRVRVDTSSLRRTAELTTREVTRAIVRGLNDSAFGLRFELPDVIDSQVDRPAPFLRVLKDTWVIKATPSSLTAALVISGGAGGVLARHEFGYKASAVQIPISRAGNRSTDRYGNLSKRVRVGLRSGTALLDTRSKKRRKAKTKKAVPRYFSVTGTESPRSRLQPGIYERVGGNKKIIRISKFEKNKTYRAKFRIREELYEYEKDLVVQRIQSSINHRLR